jgi:hypothetical protein
MPNIFRKRSNGNALPISKLESALSELRDRRARLVEKHAAAEQELRQAIESSQDRTPHRAIELATPPAAANYRASGLVLWPGSDLSAAPANVRSWESSGSGDGVLETT